MHAFSLFHTIPLGRVLSAANLVDSKLRLFIFGHVPIMTKLRTILAPAMGTSHEAVMAPAVADSSKLGYAKLYRLMLDHVSLHHFEICMQQNTVIDNV